MLTVAFLVVFLFALAAVGESLAEQAIDKNSENG